MLTYKVLTHKRRRGRRAEPVPSSTKALVGTDTVVVSRTTIRSGGGVDEVGKKTVEQSAIRLIVFFVVASSVMNAAKPRES